MKTPYACSACTDCLIWIANGEEPEDNPDGWSPPDGEYTCGWIAEEYDDPTDEERDSLGFSWSDCDCCSSGLGGERYAVTLWVSDEAGWTIYEVIHTLAALIIAFALVLIPALAFFL